jgi:hypothetical protein
MTAMNDELDKIQKLLSDYIDSVRLELAARWRLWPLNLMQPELHEVIGALMARQVTLATQLAFSPGTWNAHIAPIILRSMADVHINLAWILRDPLERSRKFIFYGLGQYKLLLEHRKAILAEKNEDPAQDPFVVTAEAWLNAQRFDFLTEVDVGSWSEVTVREMAEKAGCLDSYRYAYAPFSAATHSMWHHISRLNLRICENPLHRYHKMPLDPDLSSDPDYLYRAAKCVEKSFKLFDETFSIQSGAASAFESLRIGLQELGAMGGQH